MDVDALSENIAVSKASKSHPPNKTGALSTHNGPISDVTNKSKSSKSIEETYQKLSQLDHILLRPDTYIGSTERQLQSFWVHDGERMQYKSVNIAPGLYKIFDEILVNAADNKVRDPSMDSLKVDVDVESGEIRILNNGAGVPVEIHKTEGIYVPELIFGHLLTSSNYNDDEKKVTGGRNGYGAKLANIFSKQFVVETCDGKRQRRYKQVFRDNMRDKSAPRITDCKSSDNWTRISFQPDLQRFGMENLDEDTVSLLRKRVYDMSGILGKTVKVYFNGEKIPVKDFQSYIDLYLGPKDGEKAVSRVHERFGDRWEVCIAPSDGVCNQVSFVNAICTSKGGTHVAYIGDQVVKYICEVMAKKHKTTKVKPFMVKNHMWVFVNCLIENPAFDSQTKDNLTLRASAFGSKCELPEPFLKKAAACGILEAVLDFANVKANKELKKGDGAKTKHIIGIPKLDDANDAGSRNSQNCTLILTEGDSAKSLAISGLSVVGRDKYGVFPLRGKLLNVRDAAASQITGNAEINNIKQILGLQHGKTYSDASSLRYGHLMIMTDQDHDGSHIKGLIMNFLHHFYPSLLKIPGFLVEFITPIIKATKGKDCISFFTLPEYESWCAAAPRQGWKIKYYKGLGTSTSAEAKEYFANIGKHCKQFVWQGDEDGDAIEMAFSKKRVEDRKDWLRAYVPGTYLDHSADTIGYHDFVHKELILFSRADLERSIPSMVDGLKPGQRKIMFSCFKRNLHSDIKVAQLAGYVAEHSAYHHGETSLATTIVGLAQNFIGSNNVNYLVPQGQFGTRIHGGKDAASARYIFTRLSALARHLFHQADDPLLKYLNEEGQSIEPEWYMPILPAVLLNGAEGIGTGWSTSIPNYDPRDIVDNLKALLDENEMFAMDPWYRGFKGTIQEVVPQNSKGGRSYLVSGIIRQLSDTTLEITELPIRKWTQDYKEFLEDMAHPEDKNATPFITDYKEYHTDDTVRFVVELPAAHMQEALAVGLHNKFKLTTKISIGNMMLFGPDGIIRRYVNPEDIIREFYQLRLDFYRRRKDLLLRISRADLLRISNKVKFILEVVSGTLKLGNRKRADVDAELESRGYDRLPTSSKFKPADNGQEDDGDGDGDGDDNRKADAKVSYDYLLSMPLGSLTLERVEALRKEASEAAAAVKRLESTSEADMWRADLDAFIEAYDEMEAEEAQHEAALASQRARAIDAERKRHAKNNSNKNSKAKAKAKGKGKGKGKGKIRDAWSSDDLDDDDLDDLDDFEEDDFEPPKVYVRRTVKERRPAPPPQAPLEGSSTAATTAASSSSVRNGAHGSGKSHKGQPPTQQPPAKSEEEMSLVERMAMRMGGLALGASGVGETGLLNASGLGSSTVALPLKRPTARKPQPKAQANSKAKRKSKTVVNEEEDEDEDDFDVESDGSAEWTDLDLADSAKQHSKATKATGKTLSAIPSSRKASVKASAVGKKTAKAPPKKGVSTRKVDADFDSDFEGASDEESTMAQHTQKQTEPSSKRPVRSREARPKKYAVDSNTGEDSDNGDDSDVYFDDESEDDYVPSE